MKYSLLILFILSLVACEQTELNWNTINKKIQQEFPEVERININELNAKDHKSIILIDVRKKEEFMVSHIAGAINLSDPFDIAEIASESEKDVVVYCSVGYRSAAIVHELKNLGINNAINLEGSIFAWSNAGLPLVNKAGSTRDVHPYDEYWGQLLN
ncbi:MAG: sulfurtransferase [marine bacterium B5-7]|nr:MAG: sulfurtransferase [marine bacterium B5-7]